MKTFEEHEFAVWRAAYGYVFAKEVTEWLRTQRGDHDVEAFIEDENRYREAADFAEAVANLAAVSLGETEP